MMLGWRVAYGDDTDVDFWWDYGEVDEGNVTFAPAMDKEISRKTRVEIVYSEKHRKFVADEFVRIRYVIRVPFDVRIDEKKLPQELAPFNIIAFRFSQRRAIINERDMEQQELLLTLRPDASLPYDTYVLPSFNLHYQYDTIVGNSHIPQEETIATGEILLEKVPVYVRALQQGNTGFLWDIFPCLVEVHADNSVVFLNFDQNSTDDPFPQFTPEYPFMLLDQRRSASANNLYRVIRYEFMLAVQDFGSQPVTLMFPNITWQHEGAAPEGINFITPKPCLFFIQRITTDTTRIIPLKKNIHEPPGERYRMLDFPLHILLATVVFGLFWIMFLVWHHFRQQEKIRTVPQVSRPVHPLHDRWPWQRLALVFRIVKARRAFYKRPGPKSCAFLRELLARRSAIRMFDKNKLTTAEICALTARELARLGGRKQDIAELLQLDHLLETGRYDKLPDTLPDNGK